MTNQSAATADCIQGLRSLKFGYLPYQPGARSPGDRRRFPAVAQKLGLNWQLYQPGKKYDVLYVTSNADLTYFHRLPRDGTRIVFEMVDSYLDRGGRDVKAAIRGVGKWLLRQHRYLELSFRQTVAAMCVRADLVLCSIPEQKALMVALNPNVHDILDMHEELGRTAPRQAKPDDAIDIFWEGIGLTASQFSVVADPLRQIAKDYPLRLHLATDLNYRPINAPVPVLSTRKMLDKMLAGLEFYLYEWNATGVRALSAQCDLGIIPLHLDRPMFRSKPENKLLIMWRLGMPVIVSSTPAYTRAMKSYGGSQWACESAQDWDRYLREAFSSEGLRQRNAAKGTAFAEEFYGVDALMRRWVEALASLL